MKVVIVSASELDSACWNPLRPLELCHKCGRVHFCTARRLKPEAEKLLERLEYHRRAIREIKKLLAKD